MSPEPISMIYIVNSPIDPIKRTAFWHCCQKCSIWRKLRVIDRMAPTRVGTSRNIRHIEKYKEHPRQRYLANAELTRLGAALAELEAKGSHGVYSAAAIKLLLLTGARVSEVLQARWERVNWQSSSIVLPDSVGVLRPGR